MKGQLCILLYVDPSNNCSYYFSITVKNLGFGEFPGGPVVKTSPSNARVTVSVPSQGAKIPHAFWPKIQNIEKKQYCSKSNKNYKKKKKV